MKKYLIFKILFFIITFVLLANDNINTKNRFTSSNVFINADSHFRLVKENYSFSNQSNGPSFFEYDKEGKLQKKIFKRSDGLKTITFYEYNEDCVLLRSVRDYGKGKKDVFTYLYNKNRKLIKRLMIRSNGQKGSEIYKYNKKGELIKAEWINFDSWITGILKFKSNKDGNPAKGSFKGKRFNADIIFTYDTDKNLIKIHWDFSMGKTQTYNFEYQKIK